MVKDVIGMLAKATAGHDTGQLYIIIQEDPAYVYLADGRTRTLGKPKRKKKKHIQLICRQYDIEGADDVALKRILKEFKGES